MFSFFFELKYAVVCLVGRKVPGIFLLDLFF